MGTPRRWFRGRGADRSGPTAAESLVLQHDVEDIAQHFECDDIGFRDHRGGARIKIHAGHFAEEIAGPSSATGLP